MRAVSLVLATALAAAAIVGWPPPGAAAAGESVPQPTAPAGESVPQPTAPIGEGAISPAQAIEDARTGDGEVVLVMGEAIGEALRADGDHVWLNVLGGGRAIGVHADGPAAAAVTTFGDWSHQGDAVLVEGVLNAGCDQHGGDLDIHASSVRVIQPGGPIVRPVGYAKGVVGLIASMAAGGLALVFMRRRRRLEV